MINLSKFINARKLMYVLLIFLPILTFGLELVTVTTYEEGLTNKRIRSQEQFISASPGYFRVDIDVETTALEQLASNTVANIIKSSTTTNSMFLTLDIDLNIAKRSPAWSGFECQSIWDKYDEWHHNGDGMNGTLISSNEVLYVKHYAPWSIDDANGLYPRAITFLSENNELKTSYGCYCVDHPTYDLALLKLTTPIFGIEPAKIMTAEEISQLPDDLHIIGSDYDGKAHPLIRDRIGSNFSIKFNPLYINLYETYGMGDSGSGVFLRVNDCTYLIGKVGSSLSGAGPIVTQERINEMRELLNTLEQ